MPAGLTLHRLHACTPARAEPVAARLALQALAADLEDAVPRSLPPQALLWLRRLHLQAPAAALVRPGAPGLRQGWVAQGRERLDAALAQAARPALGPVPAEAGAVLFADEAEMLACLALAARSGELDRWWWRGLLGRRWPQWEAAWAARPQAQGAARRLLARLAAQGAGQVGDVTGAVDDAAHGGVGSPAPAFTDGQRAAPHEGGEAPLRGARTAAAVAGMPATPAPPGVAVRPSGAGVHEPGGAVPERPPGEHRRGVPDAVARPPARRAHGADPAVRSPQAVPPAAPPAGAVGDAGPRGVSGPRQAAPLLPPPVAGGEMPGPGVGDLPMPAALPVAVPGAPAPHARRSPRLPSAPAPAPATLLPLGAGAATPDTAAAAVRPAPVAPRSPAGPAELPPAAPLWPWPEARLSHSAPLLFIVNALLEDGLYPDFTRPRDAGLPVPLWALLAALARVWRLPADPLLALLEERAPAWEAGDLPAAPGVAAGPWGAWLPAYARSLRRRLGRRLGVPARRWASALQLPQPARLWVSEADWVVEFDLAHHDVAWRLAGLDRDPGWLPTVDTRLQFRFS